MKGSPVRVRASALGKRCKEGESPAKHDSYARGADLGAGAAFTLLSGSVSEAIKLTLHADVAATMAL
jgi:hypothetical protein